MSKDQLVRLSDDGEGHIGTVCELGRAGSTYSPEKTVIVNWDSGNRSNYRVGYQDQYDLVVVDNAQIGMIFMAHLYFFCTHLVRLLIKFICNILLSHSIIKGVRHANIICDGCSKSGLAGIRFRCAQCQNFDLCSSCYGDDVHDLNHEFIRFTTANSTG